MALTDAKIRAAKPQDKPYKLADSGNMFLLFHPNGSRYWRLRYRFLGKEKMLALGVYPDVSLSAARDKRDLARKLIADGIDPCEQKRVKKSVPDTASTFEAVTLQWHKSNKKWSESHSAKILKSFESHVALLNKSGLDKTTPYQSFSQAIRTLFGMPARVILFKARIMAIASPTCAS